MAEIAHPAHIDRCGPCRWGRYYDVDQLLAAPCLSPETRYTAPTACRSRQKKPV